MRVSDHRMIAVLIESDWASFGMVLLAHGVVNIVCFIVAEADFK